MKATELEGGGMRRTVREQCESEEVDPSHRGEQ